MNSTSLRGRAIRAMPWSQLAYWSALAIAACDEYIRLRVLRAPAVTALIVGILVLTYFFLELSGLPRLSMMWVSLVGWSIFIAQMLRLMREPR